MNRRKIHHSFLLLGALLAASSAWAQTSVNERHPLASGGRIEIGNVSGRVSVRGWDRDEVVLTGTLGEGLKLDVQSSRDRVQFDVVYPRMRYSDGGADLVLKVPRGAQLQATTVSAELDIAEVDLARLRAETVSGELSVAGRSGEAVLETVSGALHSRLAAQRWRGNTISGELVAEGMRGDVNAETVSGRVQLGVADIARLRASTVSGSQKIATTGLAPGGSIGLESVSGSIDLQLPADTSAQLRVDTFSGSIASDAGQVQKEEHGPGRSLATRLGGGNGDVTVESHSGSVRVTRGR